MPVIDGRNQMVVIGANTNVQIGPPCFFKILDGWWQDMQAGDTLSFFDAVGTPFAYSPSTDLVPVAIGRLDWIRCPLTVTTTGSATQHVYFVKGNR